MGLEMTSNQIIERLAPGTIKLKANVNNLCYDDVANMIPVHGKYIGITGTGDFDHARSTSGSFSFAFESKVVGKVPMGVDNRNSVEFARKVIPAINHFKDVAPETIVIIAKVDNEQPKPVIIQKLIEGKPICKTPFNKIFNLSTLNDVLKIVKSMDSWFDKYKTYDLCGQKPAKTIMGLIATYIPFLSDNIMVDINGRAWLADNILLVEETNRSKKISKILKRKMLHMIPELIVKSLIAVKKVDMFISKIIRRPSLELQQ